MHTAASKSTAPYFVNGKSGSIRNNAATIFYGGTIASPNYSSLGLSFLGYRSGVSSENIPYRDSTPMNVGVVTGLNNGTWQKMYQGRYVMLTYTSYLAGTINSILRFASSFGQKGGQNLYNPKFYTPRYIMAGGWDYVTGMPYARLNPGTSMPVTIDPMNPEAYPGTRAIPGRLFFIATTTAKDGVPFVTNYKSKTN